MSEALASVDSAGNVTLPERTIPPPRSISAEARRYLSTPFPISEEWPTDPRATAAWKRQIAAVDAGFLAQQEPMLRMLPARVERQTMNGVPVYVGTPTGAHARERAALYLHGGGMIVFGGELVRVQAATSALQLDCRSYAVDYRMPPDHPYPAALDDCLAVYRRIIETHAPSELVVAGSSAGGNLAAALALRARDEGLPAPAALLLLTPEVDLTESGDTFQTNAGIDIVLKQGLMSLNLLYAGGHDLSHPYLSPLFGDFTRGFPPTLIQAGTRDLFLSNAVRMHRALRRCGLEAELHVFEAMPHGGFGGSAPEDAELRAELTRFMNKHCGTEHRSSRG
jgi:acetyl esterase/lipase